MFLMGNAGTGENGNVPRITPLVVCHETNSSTLGLSGLFRSIHASDGEMLGGCDRVIQDRWGQPGFGKT